MKAMLCHEWCGPDDLKLEDVASPEPGAGEVQIDVHCAGVNFPDLLMIAGKYQFKPAFPFSPGMEVGGVISAVGEGVSGFKPGDRVMAMTSMGGGYAEQAIATAAKTFLLPDGVTFEQAAGFPVTYGTTYHALKDRGELKPGEVLLVHGASGGVGLNAVELGKRMGATVIGTVGSDAKMDIVKEYGADHVFNYSEHSIRDKVKELTGGQGADVIYDPVGGDAFDESLRCINWGGRLLVIGFASGRIPEAKANLVLLKQCQIVGVFWGAWTERNPEECRSQFGTLLDWCAEGKLRPHVSMTFPLEQAPDAMKALAARKATGKVIVNVR
ncbi:NADPH:quinone oxidoreductase family protein [Minwuia sp. IMCC3060]|uniref:NADPH:quinone oxidoreductase family protein n=1 Tax=Minwuia sp. IMCC3060 TaxID=3040675 RepID=UPI0024797B31|nr:NADPH:quinone oxidoreductase family protein [Minwuia sp. IMCC3060]